MYKIATSCNSEHLLNVHTMIAWLEQLRTCLISAWCTVGVFEEGVRVEPFSFFFFFTSMREANTLSRLKCKLDDAFSRCSAEYVKFERTKEALLLPISFKIQWFPGLCFKSCSITTACFLESRIVCNSFQCFLRRYISLSCSVRRNIASFVLTKSFITRKIN